MSIITYDALNIYVSTKVPTHPFAKGILWIITICMVVASFWLAIALQEDKPNPLPFLLPVFYMLTLGRFSIWNIMGEEMMVISTTHISHQHNYGFWKTKLKTHSYTVIEPYSGENSETQLKLAFIKYDSDTKLPTTVFENALKIDLKDYQKIIECLEDYKIDDLSREKGFPIFIPN